MPPVDFPFERGESYPILSLRAFFQKLTEARQADPKFSGEVRSNHLDWAKVWNEELAPTLLFANQKPISDEACFRLMPEGHPTDVELFVSGHEIALQITIADPSWADAGPISRGGYLYHLQTELLRAGRPAFVGRKTEKLRGKIVSGPDAIDVNETWQACCRAIEKAVKRKAHHDISQSTLLIYARQQRFLLIDFDMAALVEAATRAVGASNFLRIVVVDEGFFWESA